ncbi:hypothetical protein FRC12_003745 [Ceratobasidium sp. 428]|nr:hypothetical protein FRC12_003745 [Ceratobasidium sp. 428]
MRNRSIVLAPINTLPTEILAVVFEMSMPRCHVRDDDYYKERTRFFDPAMVCAYWRRVAIDSSNLWAHIDAGPSTPTGLTNLLLKRAKDTPIYVHVYEFYEPDTTASNQIDETLLLLEPHMHRVHTLDIFTNNADTSLIVRILNAWLNRGNKSLARSFTVGLLHRPGYLVLDNTVSGGQIDITKTENGRDMLRSLSTLSLYGVVFDWNSTAYQGLVDLQLHGMRSDGCYTITTSQFATLLSANPALVVLKLGGLISLCRTAGWDQPPPILMNHLSVLNLVMLDSDSSELVLSLISASSSLSEISLGVSVQPGHLNNELESFLLRSRITTLYCGAKSPLRFSSVYQLPPRQLVPDLCNLVIGYLNIYPNTVPTRIDQLNLPIVSPPHSLKIILHRCMVTLEGLYNLVLSYGAQQLQLELCRAEHEWEESLDDMKNKLLETHPQLQCRISDVASTWELPCRTI